MSGCREELPMDGLYTWPSRAQRLWDFLRSMQISLNSCSSLQISKAAAWGSGYWTLRKLSAQANSI